ncbi:MAG: hypothetical protein ACE5EA_09635 [Nitrospirota bacterium]
MEFVYRTLRTSVWVSLIAGIWSAIYYDIFTSSNLLIGAGFGILNLWLLTLLVQTLFSRNKKKIWILFLLFLKFPLLYGGGYVILKKFEMSSGLIMSGFSLIFMVILLKALALLFICKDRKEILWWKELKKAPQR